jgi:hypothetical protein
VTGRAKSQAAQRVKPFQSCLQNQVEVDEVSLFNMGDQVAYNVAAGQTIVQQMRQQMERCGVQHQQFLQFSTAGMELNDQIEAELRHGAIAAVDGTDRLSPMTFTTTSFYATGVAWVTSQSRGTPKIHLTSTTAALGLQPEEAKGLDMWQLSKAMEDAGSEGSWSTTFREYQERTCARDLPDTVETCLIDGPIFTQNLMTQGAGRDLIGELVAQKRRYIGVIKGLDGSWPICRWAAQALQPDEVFVLCSIQEAFTQRFMQEGGSHPAAPWMQKHAPTYVRCVFRPNLKAFAFECALEDLPYAVALLRQDANRQVGHETPRLLQIVDAFCRHSRNSSQAKQRLLDQVRRQDRQMAEDLSDERDSR